MRNTKEAVAARHKDIRDAVRNYGPRGQDELLRLLKEYWNIEITQAQLSRDLAAIGAYKRDGAYRLPCTNCPHCGGSL